MVQYYDENCIKVEFIDIILVGIMKINLYDEDVMTNFYSICIQSLSQLSEKLLLIQNQLEISHNLGLLKDNKLYNPYLVGSSMYLEYLELIKEYEREKLKDNAEKLLNAGLKLFQNPFFSLYFRKQDCQLYDIITHNPFNIIDCENLKIFYNSLVNSINPVDAIKKIKIAYSNIVNSLVMYVTAIDEKNIDILNVKTMYRPCMKAPKPAFYLPFHLFGAVFALLLFDKMAPTCMSSVFKLLGYFDVERLIFFYSTVPLYIFKELLNNALLIANLGAHSTLIYDALLQLDMLFKANKMKKQNFEMECSKQLYYRKNKIIIDIFEESQLLISKVYLPEESFYIKEWLNMALFTESIYTLITRADDTLGLALFHELLPPNMKAKLFEQYIHVFQFMAMLQLYNTEFVIRRSHILDDALNNLANGHWSLSNKATSLIMRSPLKVKFLDEAGVDGGGLRKEFFTIITEQLLNPDYGIIKYVNNNTIHWFTGNDIGMQIQVELIGLIIGLAVNNMDVLNVNFPLVLYKKLLCGNKQLLKKKAIYDKNWKDYSLNVKLNYNEPYKSFVQQASKETSHNLVKHYAYFMDDFVPTLYDLYTIEPDIAINLQKLLKLSLESDLKELELYFSIDIDYFGEIKTICLKKQNGEDYPNNYQVTNDNVEEYVEAVLQYYLVDSVSDMFDSFYVGFLRACASSLLDNLTPLCLQQLVCGVSNEINVDELEKYAVYTDRYTKDSQQIKWFWIAVRNMSSDEKRDLLLFITGTNRVPIGGMKFANIKIGNPGGDTDKIPWSHTCDRFLLLPEYKTYEELDKKLKISIKHNQGFGLY